MRRIMLVAPCVALALGALVPHDERGPLDLSACVQLDPEPAADGISLRFGNTCEHDFICELAWRLRCEGDRPGEFRPCGTAFTLDATSTRELLVSGDTCNGRTWQIVVDAWVCRHVP